VVRLNTKDETMMVHAFRKGIVPGLFSESLIKNRLKTFTEIRHRTVAHIAAEGEVNKKRTCVERLKIPPKTDKKLRPNKNVWCEFHQEFGHPIHNCLALGHQLDELVKNDFLRDYLQETQGVEDVAVTG